MATGGGKTVCACMVMDQAVQRQKRVLFLAHRRELVWQCSNKLDAFGIRHGVIMSGEEYMLSHLVQVASKDTLAARAVRRRKLRLPPADILILDECHRATAKTWQSIIDAYPSAIIIGLTATPARGDGTGLGSVFEEIVQAVPMAQLIAEGHLVPTRIFAPYRPDLKGVRITGGDYEQRGLESRMDRGSLVGDIVEHWQSRATGRPTMVFASGVRHSMHIRDQFTSAGWRAAHVDGNTELEERKDLFRRLANRDLDILCNCEVAVEGIDIPEIGCVVLARPTKSIVKYRQMIGRGMRPADDKQDLLILDHAGAIYQHGFPDEEVDWTLDGDLRKPKEGTKSKPRDLIVCKKCFCCYYKEGQCPNCGYKPQHTSQNRTGHRDGELVEVRRGVVYGESLEDLQRYWQRCLYITAAKGQGAHVAAGMFQSEFKKLPWDSGVTPLPPRDQWKRKVSELFPKFSRHVGKPN